jgi:hypothetical protein
MKRDSSLVAAGLAFASLMWPGALQSAEVLSRSNLQRDVEAYTVATCLTLQQQDFLKAQGDAWGSVIINRGHGDVEDWHPLIAAVKEVVETERLPVAHGDGNDLELPVAFCVEFVDRPQVFDAIKQTIEAMAPAYLGR